MEINSRQKSPKVAKIFRCETCEYICSKQSDFNKHCSTRKHKMEIMEKTKELNGNKNVEQHNTGYNCLQCGKKYETNAGLWKHSKKCKPAQKEKNSMVIHDDDVANLPIHNYIMKLVEQNMQLSEQTTELKNMFIQQNAELHGKIDTLAENPPQQITNNIQKITNNNQFNLNVFLQQTCKDALNMSEFIDSLEINTKSLERTGTHGYVHGISKIFTDGLRKLKVHERPIHCTDLKREVLYIKDNDTWTKDTEDNKQFKKALATVVHRNMIQIVKWEEDNPDTSNPESKTYEFYFEVVRQSLGGGDHEVTARNNDKILKAIAQEVHIDKKVKELL